MSFVTSHVIPPSVLIAGNINPTTDGGKALQCVMGLSGVLSLTFPIGVVSGELDRAYTKHFKAMKAASDARRRAVMVEAAQIRAELAKANAQRLMASRIIRGMRNLIRARRFKVRLNERVDDRLWMVR